MGKVTMRINRNGEEQVELHHIQYKRANAIHLRRKEEPDGVIGLLIVLIFDFSTSR